jgi:hypothetical protein
MLPVGVANTRISTDYAQKSPGSPYTARVDSSSPVDISGVLYWGTLFKNPVLVES